MEFTLWAGYNTAIFLIKKAWKGSHPVKKAAVGVDIGGGSVKLGLVSLNGRVLLRETFATKSIHGRAAFLDVLAAHVADVLAQAGRIGVRVRGVGVGAPGPIDVDRGFVYFFPNIPGWKDTPLKQWLEKRFKLPVWVDNDANAMTLAEARFGAGRGSRNVIVLTLGTGVGGGLVINGQLFHGPAYSAAEIGHLVINENGPRCACGNRGCIETYVGSGHFVREVRRRLKRGGTSVLKKWMVKDKKEMTPLLVARAARRGDAFSKKVWRTTAGHLATALAGLVNIFNPERVILGGGIAQNGAVLFRPLVRELRKKAFPIAARSARVVPAALGLDSGLIGAAALVFEKQGDF